MATGVCSNRRASVVHKRLWDYLRCTTEANDYHLGEHVRVLHGCVCNKEALYRPAILCGVMPDLSCQPFVSESQQSVT